MGEQIVVAGRSPARRRMVAMDYRFGELGSEFKLRKEIETWMLAPGDSFDSPPDRVEIIAELTRDAMTLTSRALV